MVGDTCFFLASSGFGIPFIGPLPASGFACSLDADTLLAGAGTDASASAGAGKASAEGSVDATAKKTKQNTAHVTQLREQTSVEDKSILTPQIWQPSKSEGQNMKWFDVESKVTNTSAALFMLMQTYPLQRSQFVQSELRLAQLQLLPL